jgi:hypothetical protein
MADMQVGAGIIDGGGNVVITLAVGAHDCFPPKKENRP